MKVIPTGTVGASISEIDLSRVKDGEVAEIKQAWYQYGVLVFREQKLSDDELLAR